MAQAGILGPVPTVARYLELALASGADLAELVRRLGRLTIDDSIVVGLGPAFVRALGVAVEGLRPFPALAGPGVVVPSTQADLWVWLKDEDRGRLVHRARAIVAAFGPGLRLAQSVDGFRYERGLDLSGYEDGTENPVGAAAIAAAIADGGALAGSSFVAVQRWRHDLDRLGEMREAARDRLIGRRRRDNFELVRAPASAHVKRTAQESFEPPAFVLRRSMPWAEDGAEGLIFVAFGHSLDAFERQLRRMTGQDDGIVDGLFQFSRPLTGSYFWCPPVRRDRLDLRLLAPARS